MPAFIRGGADECRLDGKRDYVFVDLKTRIC